MVVLSQSDCEIIKLPCRLIPGRHGYQTFQTQSGHIRLWIGLPQHFSEEPEEWSDIERFSILGSESSGEVFRFCFDISVFVFIFFPLFAEMQK